MRSVNPLVRPALVARVPVAAGETITQALRADHNAVRALIRRVLANPTLARSLYPRISNDLKRHSHAEEQTYYSALARIPAMREQIRLMQREHASLAAMLRRLDGTAYEHPVWMSRFLAAKNALTKHLLFEEDRVFPESEQLLTPAQQRILASRYRAMMAGPGRRAPAARVVPGRRLAGRRLLRRPRGLWDAAVDLIFPVDR